MHMHLVENYYCKEITNIDERRKESAQFSANCFLVRDIVLSAEIHIVKRTNCFCKFTNLVCTLRNSV